MTKKVETRAVGLSGIAVLPSRTRALRPEKVDEMAESMKQLGQLQPIVIRPREGIGFYLVAGAHRLAAAKQLNWPSIRCEIPEGLEGDDALLVEIDENLARADLRPAETCWLEHLRKDIYERRHPKTKTGKAPGAGRGKGKKGRLEESQDEILPNEDGPDAYIDERANKTGKSRATIGRQFRRGGQIPGVAELADTSLDSGDELDALIELGKEAPEIQEDLMARAKNGEKVSAKTAVKKQRRKKKEQELGAKTVAVSEAAGDKLYNVILADPPWKFKPWSDETGMDRAADNHYPTDTLEGIKGQQVPAADDCVLFLWATVPMLPEALEVMAAWGFTYKSHFAWNKVKPGTGYWSRNQHELLLVGVKGKVPAPAPGEQYPSIITAEATEHSKKPFQFHEMIEEMFPSAQRLEMYARENYAGWDAWGNEASKVEAA